uniref:Uncharacterized protein n=1 Tax=Arundo donax TaxID=35708 RepID=A0A0A8YLZ8_ARUDO
MLHWTYCGLFFFYSIYFFSSVLLQRVEVLSDSSYAYRTAISNTWCFVMAG